MFEALKKNLEHEKKIIGDMLAIKKAMEGDKGNGSFYLSGLKALSNQIILLNKTVPEYLKEWSPIVKSAYRKMDVPVKVGEGKIGGKMGTPSKKSIIDVSYVSPSSKERKYISINKKDKAKFLEGLKLSEGAFNSINRERKKLEVGGVQKPNAYVKFSNKYFRKYSDKLSLRFDSLSQDLKKANMNILLSSYLSMAMMSSLISFVLGFIFFIVLLFFSLSNWVYFVLPFVFVALTLTGFYLYPASEASSVKKKISYELPFATIHMAAIAGSDIEPTKIFKMIMNSPEYPNLAKEIRKIVIQIDVYGYDIVTSLKNVASRTSNKKLSELFSGLSTNIATGGALKNYLEKKSENFLVDYRLEREQYSELAGTFMDVYISILIAAPLVLMMVFIVMNVAGLNMGGLGISALLALSIVGIIIVNIVFLAVLNFKQPKV